MNIRLPEARTKTSGPRAALVILIILSLLSFSTAASTFAQQRFSKKYRAHRNVRLQLTNRSGTITVEGWDRDEIKVFADMDAPAARLTPEVSADGIVIDVTRDNRGRADLGDVNFKVWVPVNSTVDIQTKRGNIKVNNVHGRLVRAHVSSEGDIELTEVRAATVTASNTMGNIFFDGELASGGTYEFKSMQGDINISIPGGSAFRLVATAPFTRRITMGAFWSDGLKSIGDGRKVVGDVGDGRALPLLTITNYRGSISFIRR